MNEKQIIIGCRKIDRKAQKVFFDTYYKDTFRLARRYLSNYHDAEDVVIVAFNKAFRNISKFEYRGEGSLKKWLNTITINEAIKAIRKIRPLYFDEQPIEEATINFNEVSLDLEMIYNVLEKMPNGYRTVFNLYAIDGYTHSEIAESLNISRNTSKSQLLKARKFIIQALSKKQIYGT